MARKKTITACWLGLNVLLFISLTVGQEVRSKTAGRLSREIAEWKLLNEEKSTSVAPPVFVTSSLNGAVEMSAGGGVQVVSGLSAFSQNQVDPIIWFKVSQYSNVPIYRSDTLNNPGAYFPISRTNYYYEMIKINPRQMGDPLLAKFHSPGGPDPDLVMIHEIGHFKFQRDWEAKFGLPLNNDPLYRKASEAYANQFELEFEMTRRDRFAVENDIAQGLKQQGYNVKVYDSYQSYRLDPNRWRFQLDNISQFPTAQRSYTSPEIIFSAKDPLSVYSQRLSRTPGDLPPTLKINRYPPPNILFSTKDPLSAYTSRISRTPASTFPLSVKTAYPPSNVLFSTKDPLSVYTPARSRLPASPPPLFIKSAYPPPNILFSTKNPLTVYTSPTYRMSVYTPSLPTTWKRK